MAWFFGLHNYSKPGKGISKDAPKKKGIALYFEILMIRFWKLMIINPVFLIFSAPAIAIGLFLSVYLLSWMAAITGINQGGELNTSISQLGIYWTIIIIQLCGTGPASAGMWSVLRKYANDTHAWVLNDFWENFKSNFRQGLAVYIINILITGCGVICFTFYSFAMPGIMAPILKGVFLGLAGLFVMMQMYIYQLMATFRLSIRKIYKYAAMLTVAYLPRNVLALAVSALLTYGVYQVFLSYPPIALVLWVTLFYSLITYTQIFITNNAIKKYILGDSTDKNSGDDEYDFLDEN